MFAKIFFKTQRSYDAVFENGNHCYRFNFKIFISRNQSEVSREPLLVISSFLSDALGMSLLSASMVLNHKISSLVETPPNETMCNSPSSSFIFQNMAKCIL